MAKTLVRKQQSVPSVNQTQHRMLQNYIKSQIYFKGFSITVNAGLNSNVGNINLGGQARFMYGMVLYIPQANTANPDTFSLTINSEVIVEKSIWWAFNPSFNALKDKPYFPIPRPLSGSDSVQLDYTATAGQIIYLTFFLSNIDPSAS